MLYRLERIRDVQNYGAGSIRHRTKACQPCVVKDKRLPGQKTAVKRSVLFARRGTGVGLGQSSLVRYYEVRQNLATRTKFIWRTSLPNSQRDGGQACISQ
jgi:hypothetical protein